MAIFVTDRKLDDLAAAAVKRGGGRLLLLGEGVYMAVNPPEGMTVFASEKDADIRGLKSIIPDNVSLLDGAGIVKLLEKENPLSV